MKFICPKGSNTFINADCFEEFYVENNLVYGVKFKSTPHAPILITECEDPENAKKALKAIINLLSEQDFDSVLNY